MPGSAKVHVGTGSRDVISPWDVADATAVAGAKLEFLLAFHALLIGNTTGEERRLSADEEAPLTTAIAAVYARCAISAERPRETLLVEELEKLADAASGHGNVAATIHSLIARLTPYTEGGPLAHIADLATTVAADPPLTLFDIAGAPDRLIPALILTIVDHIEHAIHQTRSLYVSGELAETGNWAGRPFLVIEEGWKLTQSHAAGAWINEYARRSRHWQLWMLWVTQFCKDADNEQGRALMENSSIRLLFRNNRRDLEFGRDPLGLSDIDIDAITGLQTRPGLYSTVYLQSASGRGQVRSILGPLEYWICSQPPQERPARPARRARRTPAATRGERCGCCAPPPGSRPTATATAPPDMAGPAVSLLVRAPLSSSAPASTVAPPPSRPRPRREADRRRRGRRARCRRCSSSVSSSARSPPACQAGAAIPGSWSGPGSLGGVAGTGVSAAELAAARRIPGVGGTRLTPGVYSPDRVPAEPKRAGYELLVDVHRHGERNPRQQRHATRLPDREQPAGSTSTARSPTSGPTPTAGPARSSSPTPAARSTAPAASTSTSSSTPARRGSRRWRRPTSGGPPTRSPSPPRRSTPGGPAITAPIGPLSPATQTGPPPASVPAAAAAAGCAAAAPLDPQLSGRVAQIAARYVGDGPSIPGFQPPLDEPRVVRLVRQRTCGGWPACRSP